MALVCAKTRFQGGKNSMLFKRVVCALIVLTTAGSVGAQSYGDWRLDITDGKVVSVMTTTDSNRVFGQVCDLDEAECVWILELSPRCEEGRTYPILANGDAQAIPLEVLCSGLIAEGSYGYVFTDFDEVDAFVRESSRVGFAFPVDGDQFSVIRFDVKGAAQALSAMRTIVEKRSRRPIRNTNTKNTLL